MVDPTSGEHYRTASRGVGQAPGTPERHHRKGAREKICTTRPLGRRARCIGYAMHIVNDHVPQRPPECRRTSSRGIASQSFTLRGIGPPIKDALTASASSHRKDHRMAPRHGGRWQSPRSQTRRSFRIQRSDDRSSPPRGVRPPSSRTSSLSASSASATLSAIAAWRPAAVASQSDPSEL